MVRAAAICALAGLCATARADDSGEALSVQAQALFDQGSVHYKAGEYRRAVDLFKAAYALSQAPVLLFNLAQAHRLDDDCREALSEYESYLRLLPDAPNRVAVLEHIEEMRQCAAQRSPQREGPPAAVTPAASPPPPATLAAPPPPPTLAAPPLPTVPPPPTASPGSDTTVPGRSLRVAGLTTAAVGLALVIGGAVASVKAAGAWDDLQRHLAPGSGTPDTWGSTEQGALDHARKDAVAAALLYSAGAAALIGGTTMFLIGRRRVARAPLSFGPRLGGAQLVWMGHF